MNSPHQATVNEVFEVAANVAVTPMDEDGRTFDSMSVPEKRRYVFEGMEQKGDQYIGVARMLKSEDRYHSTMPLISVILNEHRHLPNGMSYIKLMDRATCLALQPAA